MGVVCTLGQEWRGRPRQMAKFSHHIRRPQGQAGCRGRGKEVRWERQESRLSSSLSSSLAPSLSSSLAPSLSSSLSISIPHLSCCILCLRNSSSIHLKSFPRSLSSYLYLSLSLISIEGEMARLLWDVAKRFLSDRCDPIYGSADGGHGQSWKTSQAASALPECVCVCLCEYMTEFVSAY